MFGRTGLGGLIRQAQQMQENMKKTRARLTDIEVGSETGNGLIKITITCTHVVRKLGINEDLIRGAIDDREMLEDLVLATINDASKKAEETTNRTVGASTQGLPAGIGDFFR